MKQDVLVFFRLEQADAVDFDLSQPAPVDVEQEALERHPKEAVDFADQARDFALGDGGGDEDFPGAQAGEGLRIARKQPVQEGRAGAVITDNKERLFERLGFVAGKEQVVEQEAGPGEERPKRPNGVKQAGQRKGVWRELPVCVLSSETKNEQAMRQNRRKLYVISQTFVQKLPDFGPAQKKRPRGPLSRVYFIRV
jgi:hypothetical protein